MAYLLWHGLAASAARHPTRPAVIHRQTVLTYAALDTESTRLAALLARHGIGRGSRVGIFMPKSHRSVVAMLGILKAGAAYVPVDPHAPARRAAFILKDCAVRGLVSTGAKLGDLGPELAELTGLTAILLADEEPPSAPPAAAPAGATLHPWSDLARVTATGDALPPGAAAAIESDPAYLLYTSGSTGNPKGVILSHRHALTFVDWGVDTFRVTHEDRLSNHAPHHFDLSVFDIYVALATGACVDIVPDQVALFPLELARWIRSERITVWYSVPSALIRLLLHGKLAGSDYPDLRIVLFAGEVFPVKYLREVMACLRHAGFYNLYGPTETNVCTYYAVPRDLHPDTTDIPIGAACANTAVFALDAEGHLAAEGKEGELYVRGPAVMLGYWGQAEKTRAVMVQNPLESAFPEMVYRTGDLVRGAAGGGYWFVGRRDHMVKSRGYRIELGEVEQVIYQHAAVKEAVVLALPDEEIGARLKAVVVLHADGPTAGDLQAHCLTRLPRYMVPESFLFENELPKTSTGKTDRVKLAERLSRSNDGGV
jgi:amino acid adenylation domain-containing protein